MVQLIIQIQIPAIMYAWKIYASTHVPIQVIWPLKLNAFDAVLLGEFGQILIVFWRRRGLLMLVFLSGFFEAKVFGSRSLFSDSLFLGDLMMALLIDLRTQFDFVFGGIKLSGQSLFDKRRSCIICHKNHFWEPHFCWLLHRVYTLKVKLHREMSMTLMI